MPTSSQPEQDDLAMILRSHPEDCTMAPLHGVITKPGQSYIPASNQKTQTVLPSTLETPISLLILFLSSQGSVWPKHKEPGAFTEVQVEQYNNNYPPIV